MKRAESNRLRLPAAKPAPRSGPQACVDERKVAEDGAAAVRVVAAAGSHCAGQEMNAFLSSAGAINSSASAVDTIRSVGATDAKCSASRSGGR